MYVIVLILEDAHLFQEFWGVAGLYGRRKATYYSITIRYRLTYDRIHIRVSERVKPVGCHHGFDRLAVWWYAVLPCIPQTLQKLTRCLLYGYCRSMEVDCTVHKETGKQKMLNGRNRSLVYSDVPFGVAAQTVEQIIQVNSSVRKPRCI